MHAYPQLLRLLCHARLLHRGVGILLWPPDRPSDWGKVLGVHGKLTLPTTPAKLQRVGGGAHASHAQPVGGLLQAEVGGHGRPLQHAKVAGRDAGAHLRCVAKAVDRKSWVARKGASTLLSKLR